MRLLKYLLASLPFVVTYGGWKLSSFLGASMGCPVPSKDPQACLVGTLNIEPLLGFIAWWGMLLWMPALLVSGLLIGSLAARQLPFPWGQRRKSSAR